MYITIRNLHKLFNRVLKRRIARAFSLLLFCERARGFHLFDSSTMSVTLRILHESCAEIEVQRLILTLLRLDERIEERVI